MTPPPPLLSPQTSPTGGFLQVVLGIAVTVVFQGNFEKDGYRLGRLAASLYRMPPQQEQGLGRNTQEGNPELPQVGQQEGGAKGGRRDRVTLDFLLAFYFV